MTVDLRHSRLSGKPVEGDASLLQGPDWDAAHVLQQGPAALLGRADAAAGQAATQEVALDPATMAFVAGKLAALIPTGLPPTGAAGGDLAGSYPAPTIKASVGLTGAPTAPTAAPGTSTTQLATTAFVAAALGLYLTTAAAASTYAPLASPTFTGDPKAPTPATADNDTSIATTAFVKAQSYLTTASAASTYAPLASPALTGTPTAPTPLAGDADTSIATTAFVAASFAPLASPTFTGTPAAPTATAGTNTTQIATTAFVGAAVAAAVGGSTPTGPAGGDLAGIYPNPTIKASVSLTGVPLSTTPTAGDSSTKIATTAFVAASFLTSALAASTYAPIASPTFTGKVTTAAAAAGGAGFNLPHGAAPTAPANGDTWTTSAGGLYVRINAATVGPLISAASIPAALPPNGAASGDLAGTYPSPTIKASVGLTGTPTAPTVATADNTTSIATTAFVKAQAYAPIASPTFTGKATTAASAAGGAGFNLPHGAAPTAPANGDLWTTTTGLFARINAATVGPFLTGGSFLALSGGTLTGELITAASAAGTAGFNLPHGAAPTAPVNGDLWTTSAGGLFARINGVTQNYAPLASPTFTGTPAAPTAATADNSTTIATTAFVKAQAYAPLASPALTGTPTAPTAATSSNTTQIATTAFALALEKAFAVCTYANLTSSAALTVVNTYVTAPGCVVGPLGNSGEIWRIDACATVSSTPPNGDYITSRIWNGAAAIGAGTTVTTISGGNHGAPACALVTLTGATTFSLQCADNTSGANGGQIVGGYIIAQRVG